MRRLYQIVLTLIAFTLAAHAQQSAYHQEVFTQARAGARVAVDGSAYHQLSWVSSGGPGACYIALDYSHDGMVWFLGGTIPIRDCTRSGSSPVRNEAGLTYVRMNVNSLSPTAAIRATYTGYQTNPGPTGTVTSVFGRTGDVVAQQGDYNVADITGAAPIFSPNFQGTPTAPTPSPGDNSTAIATTAWVTQHCTSCGGGSSGPPTSLLFGSTTIPLGTAPTSGQYLMFDGTNIIGGTPSGGGGGGAVSSVFGRTGAIVAASGDYNVGQITGAAPLASPNLTGIPTGPTAAPGTNTTQLATTAFVLANAAGGGSALQGCSTAQSGQLVCTTSVQGGTGTVGMLTMPYASGGLPTPPADAHAAIAPDSGGHLFWSPGNGTAFAAIGTGGGGSAGVASFNGRTGAVMPQASDYSAFFAPISGGGGGTGTATALQFGSSTFPHSTTAPTEGECLAVSQDAIVGISCGPLGGVTMVE